MKLKSVIVANNLFIDEILDEMNKHQFKIEASNLYHDFFTEIVIHNLLVSLRKQGFDSLDEIIHYINNNEIMVFLSDLELDIFSNEEIYFTEITDLV
jgi:hypothetical protein